MGRDEIFYGTKICAIVLTFQDLGFSLITGESGITIENNIDKQYRSVFLVQTLLIFISTVEVAKKLACVEVVGFRIL